MVQVFEALVATKALWLPALGRLVGAASATRPGRKIESGLKQGLTWLRDPAPEKAFFEAFTTGVERYSKEKGASVIARSAARILTRCVEDKNSGADLSIVVDQIFPEGVDQDALVQVASRKAVVLEDARVSPEQTAGALRTLLCDYLRPAFRAHPHFTERVAFSEMTTLLREIRTELAESSPDLELLGREYRAKIIALYDIIPMQGISPKVQNRTIGILMEDIFVPLKVAPDALLTGRRLAETAATSRFFTSWKVADLSKSAVECSPAPGTFAALTEHLIKIQHPGSRGDGFV